MNHRTQSSLLALATIAGLSAAAAAQTAVPLSVVAATGQPAPGTAAGVRLSNFQTPVINPAGQVAFLATLAGTGVDSTNEQAALRSVGTGLFMAVRQGDAAPAATGSANLRIGSLRDVLIDSRGCVFFSAALAGPGVTASTNAAMYLGLPNSEGFGLIARAGATVPGSGGARLKTFSTPVLSGNGTVAFSATLAGTGVNFYNDRAIVGAAAGVGGGLSIVARTNTTAPGMGAGTSFNSLGNPSIDPTGRVGFAAFLTGASVSPTNDAALFAGNIGSLALVVREGDQPGNLPIGLRFSAFAPPVLAAGDRFAFFAAITGPGISQYSDMTIYSGTTASPSLVTRTSNQIPGAGGLVLNTFGYPVMNASGHVAFLCSLGGSSAITLDNDLAIVSNVSGSLAMVAREGDEAPGAGSGVRIDALAAPMINSLGQVVIPAILRGEGITAANNRAIFSYDTTHGLRLVVRSGQSIPVNGVAKPVASIALASTSGAQDGRPSALSDGGRLAFAAYFADGSAAVVIATLDTPASPADIVGSNGVAPGNGIVDGHDYIAFINAYFAHAPLADVASLGGNTPADGQVTPDDYIAFLNAFMNPSI